MVTRPGLPALLDLSAVAVLWTSVVARAEVIEEGRLVCGHLTHQRSEEALASAGTGRASQVMSNCCTEKAS